MAEREFSKGRESADRLTPAGRAIQALADQIGRRIEEAQRMRRESDEYDKVMIEGATHQAKILRQLQRILDQLAENTHRSREEWNRPFDSLAVKPKELAERGKGTGEWAPRRIQRSPLDDRNYAANLRVALDYLSDKLRRAHDQAAGRQTSPEVSGVYQRLEEALINFRQQYQL